MYETRENNARILSKFVPYKLYKQNTEKSRSEKKREKRKAKFAPLVYRRTENESGSARTCKWLGIRWVVPGGVVGFSPGSWRVRRVRRDIVGWMLDAAERQKNYVWREIKQ